MMTRLLTKVGKKQTVFTRIISKVSRLSKIVYLNFMKINEISTDQKGEISQIVCFFLLFRIFGLDILVL